MTPNRLEAFSDGVIAVAITLLVLDITVPDPGSAHGLAHALGHNWPKYAAYAVSFLTIGIIWINHHVMVGRLREVDHSILLLNLFLLLTIGILPFATALMSRYLQESSGQHLAAAVYAGAFELMSIAFSLLQHHILFARAHLLRGEMSLEHRRRLFRRTQTGLVPYLIAVALAPLSAYVTLAICAALAVFYALPNAASVSTP